MTYQIKPEIVPGALVLIAREADYDEWAGEWGEDNDAGLGRIGLFDPDDETPESDQGCWVLFRRADGERDRVTFPHCSLGRVSEKLLTRAEWRTLEAQHD